MLLEFGAVLVEAVSDVGGRSREQWALLVLEP